MEHAFASVSLLLAASWQHAQHSHWVQFARGEDGFPYAIKFFFKRRDFDLEHRMYQHAAIASTLPKRFAYDANCDEAVVSPSGFVYPPFMVQARDLWLGEPCA